LIPDDGLVNQFTQDAKLVSYYSKLTNKVAILIWRTCTSVDMANFRRMLNGLQHEDVSEEGQDLVEESRSF